MVTRTAALLMTLIPAVVHAAGQQFTVEVLPPRITVEVLQPVTSPPVAEEPPCIVVAYTTAICGPCNRWKATEKDKLIAAGIRVEYLDANNLSPEWSAWVNQARRDHKMPIDTVPHFFVLSGKDRTLIGKPLSGFKSAMHLISVGTRRNFMAPPKKHDLTYDTPPQSMSHGDMVALHDQLHGGGSWTWPGNLAQHLQQAHGVTTELISRPVRSMRSFCPTCPVQ